MNKIPLLIGDRIGLDHFPYPVRTRAEVEALRDEFDPGTDLDDYYPVGVDLATLMILAWRVRRWQLNTFSFSAFYDYTLEGEGPFHAFSDMGLETPAPDFGEPPENDERVTVSGLEYDLKLDQTTRPVGNALSEFYLNLVPNGTYGVDAEITDYSDIDPSAYPHYAASLFLNSGVQQSIIYDDSVNPDAPYWPCLVFEFSAIYGGNFSYLFNSRRGGGAGAVTINLGDTGRTIQVPLQYSWFSSVPGATTVDFGGTADVQFNAFEFFEYSTKGGDPVYDSATGVLLNSPFS